MNQDQLRHLRAAALAMRAAEHRAERADYFGDRAGAIIARADANAQRRRILAARHSAPEPTA